jgi:hypothetical protein
MLKKVVISCFFVALSILPIRAAVTDRIALNEKLCRPAPIALLQPLNIGWQKFGRYVHLCPVYNQDIMIVMYVLTPRIDIGGKDFPFVNELIKEGISVPDQALILDAQGRILGKLPGNFPFDPPDMFEVTFTDWHRGFPFRIEFYYHASDMHGPEHPDPLYWNARIRMFQTSRP